MINSFLPISKEDLKARQWKELDIILITGDAYVDHHSFGTAVIGRVLESKGYKVGIIAQPDWRSKKDFLKLGKPRLFFGISSGNVDSLVANYTANKRLRKVDSYSPGEKCGMRPDRAVIVYANKVREIFGNIPIILGGIEASLRRFAHYDYWDNSIRRSILIDSRGDILIYGMGETQIIEIAECLKKGVDVNNLNNIRGTTVVRRDYGFIKDYVMTPSFKEVSEDKNNFNKSFKIIYSEQNPFSSKSVVQKYENRAVIQMPPPLPLKENELDKIYELHYTRSWHPMYNRCGGIKAFESVKFSITSHRGCCGECGFCTLYFHQGRIVQSRSQKSILQEINLIAQSKEFKGTITDIGGPTANLYRAYCNLWEDRGFCNNKACLVPNKCRNLELGYKDALTLYRKARAIPKIKHIFIGSGFRYDLLADKYSESYLKELCEFHISGQMKVAPEHISDKVLKIMNKTSFGLYEKFANKFYQINKKVNKKNCLVNYFISGHPGSDLNDSLQLGLYLKDKKIHPEQIQDFIPLPMSLSGCIYYTGKHPLTGEKIYVPVTFKERKKQRAFLQYRNPKSKQLILEALKELKLTDLFGKFFGRKKYIKDLGGRETEDRSQRTKVGRQRSEDGRKGEKRKTRDESLCSDEGRLGEGKRGEGRQKTGDGRFKEKGKRKKRRR